ncbi:MAG TPA: hypothetical protein VMB26_15610, partial [Candidatus Binataceae bacterium]|nr:hypothetical protein [Candidatus Binataceae bacterium]
AQEFLKDPKKARVLAEAIRTSRRELKDSLTVPLDGGTLTVRLAGFEERPPMTSRSFVLDA